MSNNEIELGDLNEVHTKEKSTKSVFTGLSKHDLMKIEEKETIWRKIRIALLILFWLAWAGLLIGSIVIIALSPKCPKKPSLETYQQSCVYRLNPSSFVDSDQSGVGDIKGVQSKLDYISKQLSAKTIILDHHLKGENNQKTAHAVSDWKNVDPTIGTLNDVKRLIKETRGKGMKLITTIDFSAVSADHEWAKKPDDKLVPAKKTAGKGLNGNSNSCKLGGKNYYSSQGADQAGNCVYINVNWNNVKAVNEIKDVLKFWLTEVNFDGVLLSNVEQYYSANDSDLYGKSFVGTITALTQYVNGLSVSSKKKYLMIEAGPTVSTGKSDAIVALSKAKDSKIADVIFSSDLLFNRGRWGKDTAVNGLLTLGNISVPLGDDQSQVSIAKPLANPHSPHNFNVELIVAATTLPSVCVIYAGDELGMNVANEKRLKVLNANAPAGLTTDTYPFSTTRFNSLFPMTGSGRYGLLNYGLFPWSDNMFNETYRKAIVGTKQNLRLLSAVGAPPSAYSLTKKLTALKTAPAMQYGNVEIVKKSNAGGTNMVAYKRSSTGRDSYLIVYIKSTKEGVSFNLKTKGCETAALEFAYPTSGTLKTGKKISIDNVFFNLGAKSSTEKESVYIFKC